jgi:predicted transcriptional regulator
MSTVELRKKIIDRLQDADENLLMQVNQYIEYAANTEVHQIPEEYLPALEEGLRQAKAGETLSNEEVHKNIEQWLSK